MSITAHAQGWATERIAVDASVWTGNLDTDGEWRFAFVPSGDNGHWEVAGPGGRSERVDGVGWMPRELRYGILHRFLGEDVGNDVYDVLQAQAT